MKNPEYAVILNKKEHENYILYYNNAINATKRRENASREIRELSPELLDVVRKNQNIINSEDQRFRGALSTLGIVE